MLHNSQQHPVFEEQKEDGGREPLKVEGGRGEEGEREGKRGESEESEEQTTLIGRVGQSFKKTLQNLKLFLT